MSRGTTKRSARFVALPGWGTWRFVDKQAGFELARFERRGGGVVVSGSSVGTEDGRPWSLRYVVQLDDRWHARSATIETDLGQRLTIKADGAGRWTINGRRALAVEGCLDLDLEASLVTNLAPVRRLALEVGQQADAPAAYVRHRDLTVERLEQSYRRLPDRSGLLRFDYRSPSVGYHACLSFARDGLVVRYPRVGARGLVARSRR